MKIKLKKMLSGLLALALLLSLFTALPRNASAANDVFRPRFPEATLVEGGVNFYWYDGLFEKDATNVYEVARKTSGSTWTVLSSVTPVPHINEGSWYGGWDCLDANVKEATTYYYRVRINGGGYLSDWTDEVSVATPPAAPTNLTATASSGSITLKWTNNSAVATQTYIDRKEGSGAWEGLDMVYANITTYVDNTVQVTKTYTYRVRVYAPGAFYSAYSNESSAFVSVTLPTIPPSITQQPVSRSILAGQNTSFYVGAVGPGILYQWQSVSGGGGLSMWTDISNGGIYSGATTSNLQLTNVPASYDGYSYRCVVRNASGAATSSSATLSVAKTYIATVIQGTGGGSYVEGATVHIIANPAPAGKVFDSWTTTDGVVFQNVTSASTSFIMPAKAVAVTAYYRDLQPATYAVTVNMGTGGGSYQAGATVSLTAAAAPAGKMFDKWISFDGVTFLVDTNPKTSFIMPAHAVEVTASYKDLPNQLVSVYSGTGTGYYPAGATVTVTANAAPAGKVFEKWTVINGGVTFADATSPVTSFTMPANPVSVVAEYKDLPKFAATVINGTGGGSYLAGAEVTIVADTASPGQLFDKWTTSDGIVFKDDSSSNTSFIMPAKAVTVTATYKEAPTYLVTVVVDDLTNGGCADNAMGPLFNLTGVFEDHTIVYIRAGFAPSGKEFDCWTSPDGVSFYDATSMNTHFLMPSKSVTIIANYKDSGAQRYRTTVNDGWGTEDYSAGTTVYITAFPPMSGKAFDKWVTEDGIVLDNANNASTSFTMPAQAVEVSATYKDIPTWQVTVNSGSFIAMRAVDDKVEAGSMVWLTADADPQGRDFDKWVTSDGITFADATSAFTTFVMPAREVTVTATYKPLPIIAYIVTVNSGTGGGSYLPGETVNIAANPAPAGKVFDSWTSFDGVIFADATSSNTAFTMPAKAVAVTATYKDPAPPTYDVTVIGGTGSGSYAAGATVNITADPAPAGKVFDGWTSFDGVIFANANNESTAFTMPAKAVTVTATYKDSAATTYDVTVIGGTGGGSFAAGATVNITADTPLKGMRFVNWTASPAVTFAGANNASTSFPMPAGNVTVTANFEGIRGDANCDGNVNAADAAAILRTLVELQTLTPQGQLNAKVTFSSGAFSAADAAKILRWLVDLEKDL